VNLRTGGALLLSVLWLVAVAGAGATTPAQLASLTGRARVSAPALRALRAVAQVDGHRADLGAALDTNGPALTARLRTLALSLKARAAPVPLAAPGATARSILSASRFRGGRVPRPLHRPLAWLGRQLHRLGIRLDHFYRVSISSLPGGANVFWMIVALAVAAAAGASAFRLGRRRSGRFLDTQPGTTRGSGPEDPRQFERDADTAERRGAYELALRLRFRAGIARLARAEAIPRRESLTNGEIDRLLASAAFHRLCADFDEIVYGERAASAADVARARDEWMRVLEENRRA
jgi:hypothetical protein